MSRRARAAEAVEVDVAPAVESAPAEAPVATRRNRAAAAEAVDAVPAHVDPAAADAPAGGRSTRRKAAGAADGTKPTSTEGSAGTTTASVTLGAVDYDSMTYDDFLVHLKQRSKRDVVEALKQKMIKDSEGRKKEKDIEPFTDGTGGYSYQVLIDRVYEELRAKNPSLSSTEASRSQIPVPNIERYGSKKTAVSNFKSICDAINRSMEEVKDYLDKELSTTGSIDSSNCLILKLQNVKSMQFEGIIIKYIDEFVKCHSCKKINSTLQKEDRITVLKCNLCQATRAVTAGGNAFHAVTGKRSKLRAANAL